MDMLNLR